MSRKRGEKMKLSIGEISKKVNLSLPTLRYYEELDLIKPERDKNNRRIYDENDVKWLEFILRLKKINMPMKEIILYSQLRTKGDKTIYERMNLLNKQMERLDNEKKEIEKSMEILAGKIDIYKMKLENNWDLQ